MHDEPRKATVTAVGSVECYSLDRTNFNEVLGSLSDMLELHKGVKMLRNVKMLAECLGQEEMEKISKALVKKSFSDGSKIINQGEDGDSFYMIEKGTVIINIDSVEVGSLCHTSATPYFGEMAIMNNEVRVASVIADGDCECYMLTRENFNSLLGNLDDIMKRESKRREEETSGAGGGLFGAIMGRRSSTRRGSLSNLSDVKFENLNILRMLGTGTFGMVSERGGECTDENTSHY